MVMNDGVQDSNDGLKSKTQRKRYMNYAQELGEALLALTPEQLSQFPLDERLADALQEATRIRSREALRRQKQFIGKLMRDADLEIIEAKLEALSNAHQAGTAAFRDLEQLRDRLVLGGKAEIGEVIGRFPGIDSQKLRQLVKRAQKEYASLRAT
jgi:ribosome-associated protein